MHTQTSLRDDKSSEKIKIIKKNKRDKAKEKTKEADDNRFIGDRSIRPAECGCPRLSGRGEGTIDVDR